MKQLNKAFTLIELLIVVAIIAILAAIAVPNFLEAQTRAKVGRTKADMRTVATALESYFVDNNHYPTDNGTQTIGGKQIRRPAPNDPTTANQTFGVELTTPIAYISSMNAAMDPFKLERAEIRNSTTLSGRERFGYQNNHLRVALNVPINVSLERMGYWGMYSAGPDRYVYHLAGQNEADFSDTAWTIVLYDPTNGTISYGDIWRTQKYGTGMAGMTN